MPILTGPIQYIGTIDDLTAYKTRNSDKVIVRRKKFISHNAFKTEPQYDAMRRNNAEFTGCAYAGKVVRNALGSLLRLADYNVSPAINKFCKAIQKQDTVGELGKRSIVFSAYKDALTAIVLNKRYLFESVVRQRPVVELLRPEGALHLHFGELIPGFNIQFPWKSSHFRFIISLGVIGDLHDKGKGYDTSYDKSKQIVSTVFSSWMPAAQKMPAQSFIVKLKQLDFLQQEDISVVAGIGIQMGTPSLLGDIEPVKYAGTARILAVA